MASPFHARASEAIPITLAACLGQAAAATARLGRDNEALHDFRVAIRRLRSWLKAFDDLIEIDPSLLKCVAKLAKRTNNCRDLEVYAAWLKQATGTLHSKRIAAYICHVEQRLAEARIDAADTIRNNWPDIERRLSDQVQIHHASSEPDASLALHLHRRLCHRLRQLDRQLKSARKATGRRKSELALHRLRITIKQLRYLLDSFTPREGDCLETVEQLKQLQDELGKHHDLCRFRTLTRASSKTQKGLKPLIRMANRERRSSYRALNHERLTGPQQWQEQLQTCIEQIGATATVS